MKKVLIGAPIRQEPEILNFYLLSLQELIKEDVDVEYFFIDDNVIEESSKLLEAFSNANNAQVVRVQNNDIYRKDEVTHVWNEKLIWKVAIYKNKIIDKAISGKYDYLFLIDSDLVLQQETLMHLIKADKDIISEIFWTKWHPNGIELPQVWLQDSYKLFEQARNEALNESEVKLRTQKFLEKLRKPGIYEVGGLGALTLIKRTVLEAGVNFNEIKNISFAGEDRHFCIRAVVNGYSLYVDTHLPAFHIYRKSELKKFMG